MAKKEKTIISNEDEGNIAKKVTEDIAYIVKTGNKQYYVKKGQNFLVDRIDCDETKTVELELLYNSKDGVLKNQTIKCNVINPLQYGEKLLIQKKRRRKHSETRTGFRAQHTCLRLA